MKHYADFESTAKTKGAVRSESLVSSKPEVRKKAEVPIWKKLNLTLEEAAAYSGIGINRLREITNERGCDFVLFIGTKRLIKRRKLEEFTDKITTL